MLTVGWQWLFVGMILRILALEKVAHFEDPFYYRGEKREGLDSECVCHILVLSG